MFELREVSSRAVSAGTAVLSLVAIVAACGLASLAPATSSGASTAPLAVSWMSSDAAPGTPARYNKVGILKIGPGTAKNVLVLEPGTSAGSAYFDALYAEHPDPWGLDERFYERRKRDLVRASLPRAHFRRAFEPGCATGLLTVELARPAPALVEVLAQQGQVEHDPGRQAVGAGLGLPAVDHEITPALAQLGHLGGRPARAGQAHRDLA